MEFWVGFAIAYCLAGALVLRLIINSHAAVHPGVRRSYVANAYVFLVWPGVLTELGTGR